MAKDILITPAAGTIDFYDTSNSYNTATIGFGESQTTGALSVYHDGSGINVLNRLNTGVVFEVYGTNGTLFSLDDDLSDSLFAVANSAGLPVFEVFADNSIVGGSYGSNNFYLDSNGNLGLGTSSPTRKLHIKGDNKVFLLSSNDYEVATIGPRGSSGSNLDAGVLGLKANGSFTVVLDAAGSTYFNGGSVGIGTSSPSTKTHIYGTLTVDSSGNSTNSYTEGIRLGASSNGYSIINYGANASASSGSQAGQWWAGKHGSNGGFNFWNATSSDVFHIKLDGNVGIGTMTPSAPLHVTGDAIINNGSPANSNMPLTVGEAGGGFATVAQFGRTGQAIYITENSPIISAGAYYNNQWVGTSTSSNFLNFAGGAFDFQIGSGSVGGTHTLASYMKLTSSGLGLGISPAVRFHVNGGNIAFVNMIDNQDMVQITRAGTYHSTHADAKLYIFDNSSADYAQKISLSGASYGLRIDGFNNYGIELNQNSLGLVFVANSTEIVVNEIGANYDFRVEGDTDTSLLVCDASADRVGIGTSSPSQKLHVNGNVTATAYYGDGSNLTGISTSSSSNTQSQKSGTTTLTLNVGSYALHVVPLAAGTTISSITYSSVPSSGTVSTIVIVLKYSGSATVTWTNVLWAGGNTPSLTGTAGKADVFSLTTYNGGTKWIGAIIGQNLDSTNL